MQVGSENSQVEMCDWAPVEKRNLAMCNVHYSWRNKRYLVTSGQPSACAISEVHTPAVKTTLRYTRFRAFNRASIQLQYFSKIII